MKSTGKAACILPHGVLFRGNAEAVIRQQLVRSGYLKAIIGLPANLFYGTGIPACILVLDKSYAAARKAWALIASTGSKTLVQKRRRKRYRTSGCPAAQECFPSTSLIQNVRASFPIDLFDPVILHLERMLAWHTSDGTLCLLNFAQRNVYPNVL